MKFARFALAALCAGALLSGCGPQVPPVGNYATIQGTVTDATSGQPITGAIVTVSVIASNPTAANGFYKVYPVPTVRTRRSPPPRPATKPTRIIPAAR